MSSRALGGQFDSQHDFHTEKSGQMSIWGGKGSMRQYMSDEARYPRGYTPERQQEVGAYLDTPHVAPGGVTKARLEASMPADESWLHPEHAKRLVRDAFARSSMPLEYLQYVHHIDAHTKPWDSVTEDLRNNGGTGVAMAHMGAAYLFPENVSDSPHMDGLVLHETGHLVDHDQRRFQGTGKDNAPRRSLFRRQDPEYVNDYMSGQTEGRADAFAHENIRARSRGKPVSADEVVSQTSYHDLITPEDLAHPENTTPWKQAYIKNSHVREINQRQAQPPPKPKPKPEQLNLF